MKNRTLFLKRLFMSAALGALLASPVLAMEEENRGRPAAAAAVAKLNAEQDKFMRDLHTTVVSGVMRPFHDVLGYFNMLNIQLTEEGFQETLTMCDTQSQIQEEFAKISKTLESDLSALKRYHTAHKAQIKTPVNVEEYLNALGAGFKEILNGFMGNVNVFMRAPTLAKSKELGLEGERLKETVRVTMERFHISDHTNSLKVFFFQGITPQESALAEQEERLRKLQIQQQKEEEDRAQEKRRRTLMRENFMHSVAGAAFGAAQAHVNEKFVAAGVGEEAIMSFSGIESLHILGEILEKESFLNVLVNLNEIRASEIKRGLMLDEMRELLNFRETILTWKMNKTGKQGDDFIGGLNTIDGHFRRNDTLRETPRNAFMQILRLLKAISDQFPSDERVNTVVLEAFSSIEDQKGRCGSGLMGRSLVLAHSVSKLLADGLENPFKK
ncbi:MAG: hypothetical protein B7Y25_07430 [Alphaproteobacteria bacterium 16-39-46]|nr:MAG: hypothetical protein B7Y25_07430 [Alphaproteobacteria bacterium 16-39-46]OZA41750.1 MAG: hypothetical protein B7X84_07480 [Alphaproteobacteria bacterium 17-39-52]HQS84746.1 hypothetical protein [Alphaproteobacteria bacterium]HQS94558.1 hypothetical protein [Alphaproteobacteria bacterium]